MDHSYSIHICKLSKKTLLSPQTAQHRVNEALGYTEWLYDKVHANEGMYPNEFRAMGDWMFIMSCYMGLEQTLKIRIRSLDQSPPDTHDLICLYNLLGASDRDF